MNLPGFTAEVSLYDKNTQYHMAVVSTAFQTQVVPQWRMPAGLCSKASRFCLRGWEQPWCDILDRCFGDL